VYLHYCANSDEPSDAELRSAMYMTRTGFARAVADLGIVPTVLSAEEASQARRSCCCGHVCVLTRARRR
jgi:hypothetical protein